MAVRRRAARAATGPHRAERSRALARYFARLAEIGDADRLSAAELREVAEGLRDDSGPRSQIAAMVLDALDAADQGRVYRPWTDGAGRR